MAEQVLVYYLWLQLVALGCLPISRHVFRSPGAGLVAAKAFGLLLLSSCAWFSGMVLGWPFDRSHILLLLLAINVASWPLLRRADWKDGVAAFLVAEGVFLSLFLLAVLVKMYFGAITGQGEKFTDLGIFAHLVRCTSLPPSDLWIAGTDYTINYYYGGYFAFALVAKLSALPIGVAYNLSLAAIVAMAGAIAFFISSALCGAYRYGLLAVLFLFLVGNLDGAVRVLSDPSYFYRVGDDPSLLVATTRAIVDGAPLISEYPFFSFVWSDLHGHLMSLPFTLVLLLFLLAVCVGGRPTNGVRCERAIVLGLILGYLTFVNAMDFPTYAALSFLLLTMIETADGWIRGSLRVLAQAAGCFALMAVFLAPLYLRYHSPLPGGFPVGISIWKTDLHEFLLAWGWQLSVVLPILVLCLWRHRAVACLSLLVSFAILYYWGYVVAGFLPLLVAGSVVALADRFDVPPERFIFTAVLLTTLLWTVPEFAYFHDFVGSDRQRMNTTFKTTIQAWTLLAVCLPFLLRELSRRRGGTVVVAGFFFLLSGAAVVSVAVGNGVVTAMHRVSPQLDGQAYLAVSHADDYAGILFLQQHVSGTPTIVEARGDPYSYYYRVSANTGLPTVLGSTLHESTVFAREPEEIRRREEDVRTIYESTDLDVVDRLLRKYDVRFVFVGELERKTYSVAGLAKFDSPAFTTLFKQREVAVVGVPSL